MSFLSAPPWPEVRQPARHVALEAQILFAVAPRKRGFLVEADEELKAETHQDA